MMNHNWWSISFAMVGERTKCNHKAQRLLRWIYRFNWGRRFQCFCGLGENQQHWTGNISSQVYAIDINIHYVLTNDQCYFCFGWSYWWSEYAQTSVCWTLSVRHYLLEITDCYRHWRMWWFTQPAVPLSIFQFLSQKKPKML